MDNIVAWRANSANNSAASARGANRVPQATAPLGTAVTPRLLVMSRPGVRVPVPAPSLVTSDDATNCDAHVAQGASTALVEQIIRPSLPSGKAANC